jgi:hypothetical protein
VDDPGLDGLPDQDWDFVITVCDRATVLTISRRLDLFLALPIEKLSRLALQHRVTEIGTSAVTGPVGEPS